ncbi:fungal-specific transcription factor domain-containing protein [Truncatella angustata]|uniref:Fungal-specific transcription factor domain-containing protein n=1 Tax=Truncatella angustata TaxID=152316 RepID=A0A9P8UXS0_9PEZI|nr:fungal-specific transcription factor domain-containing protein [Truncatella angustata]KAH6660172.1 fungal-specific transcription factor domain-containing protein [Truncatella angustata]
MHSSRPLATSARLCICLTNTVSVSCQKAGETCDYSIRLNWDGRRGKKPEPGTIDFSQEVPSPTVPAKGFKLVHQFPTSNNTSTRKLEPLVSPDSSSKPDSNFTTPSADTSSTAYDSPSDQFQVPNKRIKLDSGSVPRESSEKRQYSSPSSTADVGTPAYGFPVSNASASASPLTPAASSVYSDGGPSRHAPRSEPSPHLMSPDLRRMSVHSLISGHGRLQDEQGGYQHLSPSQWESLLPSHPNGPKLYGVDRGLPDLDLGKNDDENAIGTGYTPLSQRDRIETPEGDFDNDLFSTDFSFGFEATDAKGETKGYYDKPVEIFIPQYLEPLPTKLIKNPMNLLYFHHFINHTAKVLVPYDDAHANPFRTTLPLMALRNENLLALILAYSASHRARLLRHPEPSLRIAFWVEDIFPALRQALSDPGQNFSDANVATAIMLASLEIVSPKVFGYSIPWQKHLSLARELIKGRPGGLHYQNNFRQDHVCSFLWSWAAYLDVMGSLTGGPKDSSTAWMFDYELEDKNDGYDEIECIMGFTTRCVYLLAKIADLARKCDIERIDPNNKIRADWKPSHDALEIAYKLEADVKYSMNRPITPCKHILAGGNVDKWDRVELAATNEAFHWAGLIHLYRRILGRPSEDLHVQIAVQEIISCFSRIRRGGSAEACSLLPIFTAGCNAKDAAQRAFVIERLGAGENQVNSAVLKVHKAKRVMEKVWETGQPWETLLSTEFIG